MRLAFLGDASLGHIQRWVSFFRDRGHEVLLLSYENCDACDFPAQRLNAPTRFQTINLLLALPDIKRRLAAFSPDLVNGLYAGGYGFCATRTSYPAVVSALGSDLLVDYPNSLPHRSLIRWTLRHADLVTTDAQVLSDIAVGAGAAPEQVFKAYFGVDNTLFHPATEEPAEEALAVSDDPPRIISTRNLHHLYRVDVLVEALALVRAERPAELIICGDGPERTNLEDLAARLGVEEACDFRGSLSSGQIAAALRESTLYVSTSSSDSTSVSLLEAMASGLPPVVSDIPANREWLTEGESGLFFPVGDAAALARALLRLLDETELRASMRHRNLTLIQERGLWSRNMEKVERRFAELIA